MSRLRSLLGAVALALLACSAPAAAPAKPAANAPAAPPPAAATSAPAASAPAASAPAANAPTAAPQRRKIEYGLVNFSAFYWPIYIGLDEGFFNREALD